jgi:hypothetical protein
MRFTNFHLGLSYFSEFAAKEKLEYVNIPILPLDNGSNIVHNSEQYWTLGICPKSFCLYTITYGRIHFDNAA